MDNKDLTNEALPPLRTDLEIVPASYRGQNGLVFKDSLGLLKEPVLVQGEAIEVVRLLDGTRTVQDIQLALIRMRGGAFVSAESIRKIARDLDSAFLLESAHYRRERERTISDYLRLEVREARLAGSSYPQTKAELEATLASILSGNEMGIDSGRAVRAVVSPHIDIEIGRRVYGQAYASIRMLRPGRVVVLGTGHGMSESFFSLTEKDFMTPLGRVRTDREWVRALRQAGGGAVEGHDMAHRSEHSIEFQVLFLQHLFGSEWRLVPILCGSFQDQIESVDRPSLIPGVGNFLGSLRGLLEDGGDALVVAGVDLFHIGPKFGHSQPASRLETEARSLDQRFLDVLCRGDSADLWAVMKAGRNWSNVCGFSTLACLKELWPLSEGRVLGYDVWNEEPARSAVSYAAVLLTVAA